MHLIDPEEKAKAINKDIFYIRIVPRSDIHSKVPCYKQHEKMFRVHCKQFGLGLWVFSISGYPGFTNNKAQC